MPEMPDLPIHVYERIPLAEAGMIMGFVLLIIHLSAVACPEKVVGLLAKACRDIRFAKVLLVVDCAWAAALLWNSPNNPLRISLYDFESIRTILLVSCLLVCAMLYKYPTPNMFGRVAGTFLLLTAALPLSASYMREETLRELIPLWWYPVLTAAMVLVVKPYLLRDAAEWMGRHLNTVRILAAAGTLYALLLLVCAFTFY